MQFALELIDFSMKEADLALRSVEQLAAHSRLYPEARGNRRRGWAHAVEVRQRVSQVMTTMMGAAGRDHSTRGCSKRAAEREASPPGLCFR